MLKWGHIGVPDGQFILRVDIVIIGQSLMAIIMGICCQQYIDSFLLINFQLISHLIIDEKSIASLPRVTRNMLRA